ncbi:DUF2690 domain-containing protein [Nonomuraea sp. MTCD27]|uniref:DUF2690 domain-containing protein n=1 Tax=Nonomuraea sp. MTCD27 TaxID=1676747 RepID=UPI0035BEF50C
MIGLAVYFSVVGLDHADKLGSVIGALVGVVGLVFTIYGIMDSSGQGANQTGGSWAQPTQGEIRTDVRGTKHNVTVITRTPDSAAPVIVIIIMVLAVMFIGTSAWMLIVPREVSPTPMASPSPQPTDGADPKEAKCDKDVQNVSTVPAETGGKYYGRLMLRYSPKCRGAWPQFVTTKQVPTGVNLRLETHRSIDGKLARFDFPYTPKPQVYTTFGNLLQTGKGCVWASVVIATPQETLVTARTPCVLLS